MNKLAVVFGVTLWVAQGAFAAEGNPPPANPSAVPMNEFSGSVVSIDYSDHLLRIALDGGYNVEFRYDSKTMAMDGHDLMKIQDLTYGDKITARYVGKELYAQQVVRTSRADGSVASAPVESPATSPIASTTPSSEVGSVVSSATPSAKNP